MKCPEFHVLGGWARRGAPLVLISVLLGACSIPVPLKFASWALDGIAYLTTEKSVTDHGISLVARKDCALWRGIKGEQICRSDDGTAIAAAEGQAVGNAEQHGNQNKRPAPVPGAAGGRRGPPRAVRKS